MSNFETLALFKLKPLPPPPPPKKKIYKKEICTGKMLPCIYIIN